MNTLEILHILGADPAVNKILLGVFPIDRLPPIPQYPAAVIANLDFSNEPGSHWVAMFFNRRMHCDYFDSYGQKPFELKEYIEKNATSYTYNNVRVQGLFSTSCGHMCIYFLHFRAKGVSFKRVVKSMHTPKIYKYFKKQCEKIKHNGS